MTTTAAIQHQPWCAEHAGPERGAGVEICSTAKRTRCPDPRFGYGASREAGQDQPRVWLDVPNGEPMTLLEASAFANGILELVSDLWVDRPELPR